MQKALTLGLLCALALALSWALVFSHASVPALQILWFPLLALVVLLLFLLTRLSHPVPASTAGTGAGHAWSWVRLGLVAGGVIGLYWAGIFALYALYPVPPLMAAYLRYRPDSVGLLSLPLLAGTVGVISSASGGTLRTGVRASLLAIAVGYVLYLASEVLLIALVWTALQRGQLHSQLAGQYQGWYYQFGGQELGQAATSLQYTFNSPYGLQPYGVLFGGLGDLLVGGPFATLGGALGIATRRTYDAQRQAAATAAADSDRLPFARSVRVVGLTLAVLAVGVLAWGFYAVLNGPYPFSLHDVSSAYAGPAFFAWLLALAVVLVCVLVSSQSVRLPLSRQASPTAPGAQREQGTPLDTPTPNRPEDAAVPRSSVPTRRRAYPVAIILLLVGGGLGAGGLFLPWWHFTFCDGSPDPGSAITPALDFGLDDLRVWWLLVIVGVAAATALVSLLLRGHLSLLLALVAGAAGLVGLGWAFLVANFWFTDSCVLKVYDAGCYTTNLGFLAVSAGAVALVQSRRRRAQAHESQVTAT